MNAWWISFIYSRHGKICGLYIEYEIDLTRKCVKFMTDGLQIKGIYNERI